MGEEEEPLGPLGEKGRKWVAKLGRRMQAEEHLRAAAHALTGDGETVALVADLDSETRDLWIAIRLVEAAVFERAGPAGRAIRDLAKAHEKDVPTLPRRTKKSERVDQLRGALRSALEESDDAPWWIACVALSTWATYQQSTHREDVLACGAGVELRFLARVALALPKGQRAALHELAMATINAVGPPTADDDEPFERWRSELAPAWEAAQTSSKSIREADAGWFLARALEAMGEDPHALTAAERKRAERANRAKAKKKTAPRKKL